MTLKSAKESSDYFVKEITTKQAVNKLCEELRNDKDYYYSWQANIAMQFQDIYWDTFKDIELDCEVNRKLIHTISNEAAQRFLNLLINIK